MAVVVSSSGEEVRGTKRRLEAVMCMVWVVWG
jgi:hypothetical protein